MGFLEPHGRYRHCDGEVHLRQDGAPFRPVASSEVEKQSLTARVVSASPDTDGVVGRITGIARHARAKAPMETIDRAEVTLQGGITGDHRGYRKPGGLGKRQITLLERIDWDAAMAEVGRNIPWYERRANLLVEGFDLPQVPGALLRIGADVVLEVTRHTDPCERMEALAPGLFAALSRDWRGGACSRVLAGGTIVVGDEIRLEEA